LLWLRLGEEKKERRKKTIEEETTGQKYSGHKGGHKKTTLEVKDLQLWNTWASSTKFKTLIGTKTLNFMRIGQGIGPCYIPKFRKIYSFEGPIPHPSADVGEIWHVGVDRSTHLCQITSTDQLWYRYSNFDNMQVLIFCKFG